MRILYLPSYFFPEKAAGSYLSDNRNQAFADAGFDITTITPTPCRGISQERRMEYCSPEHRREMMYDGRMEVFRFRLFPEGKNPILRALRYSLCWIKQFNRGLRVKNVGCIYLASTPPIQGVLGCMLKKIKKVPFVYNLQDIFPDSLIGTGLAKKGSLLWKMGRVIENYTYRNANRIIVISEDFKKNIMAKGVPEEKIEVIYNWVDEKAVKPVAKENNPLFEEFGLDRKKYTVVYAGNLGYAQNINIVIDAAYMLPEVQFAVFGIGGLESEIRSRIEKEGLMNVHLNPLQPMERVSQVYSLGDACVVSCKEGLGGSAMPSKTWSIMSCGRPVVASFDEGELKDIIENNDCGLFSHAGNVQEFVEAIKQLASTPERCAEMGKNARRYIEENLTKEVGTKKYVDVIKSFEKK